MGQKTVAIIAFLTVIAMGFSLGGAIMSTHKVSFFTGYVLRAVRLETHLFTVEINDKSSLFCNTINKVRPGTCSSGSFALHDVSQQFCAPVIANLYPQACEGFHLAYLLGMTMAFAIALNAMLCVAGVWLLHSYITSTNHKKSYRQNSMILIFCGTLILAASLATYGVFVFRALDNMRPRGLGVLGELAFKPSETAGLSWGYLSLVLNVVVQIIILLLFPLAKTSEEVSKDELEERKIRQEYATESGYGAAGGPAAPAAQPQGAWGTGPGADAADYAQQLGYGPQPSYVQQPYMQPSYAQQPMPMQPGYGAQSGW
mmetsp:Transcript_100018/g.260811  ORF Transcript_100018/g.260811 Transcript_100018/m.260811 type:complete len:315 (+) Transcript_100018:111-1055(+)